MDDVSTTSGHLLGKRVRYIQPRQGFRSGIEPVLLAASLPAKPGDRVLEGGTGAGATLLCLASRVSSVQGVGIDQDAALVALAEQNAAANRWPALRFFAADIASLPDLGLFDHACANPPYHTDRGTSSPDASRQAAKHAPVNTLAIWTGALSRKLRPSGTLSFVLPAAVLPEAIAAFAAAGCKASAMLPFWPKAGTNAKLVLLRGVKYGDAPFQVLPGLILHGDVGKFTPQAESILREGNTLVL